MLAGAEGTSGVHESVVLLSASLRERNDTVAAMIDDMRQHF